MKLKAIIGIDPGLKGAIAIMTLDKSYVNVIDVPVLHGSVDYIELHKILLNMIYDKFNIIMVIIEQVNAMPSQGVSSMFKFGETYGILQAISSMYTKWIKRVMPYEWKGHYDLIHEEKQASLDKAIELFPSLYGSLNLKKYDGRAEALLIAEYGLLLYNKHIISINERYKPTGKYVKVQFTDYRQNYIKGELLTIELYKSNGKLLPRKYLIKAMEKLYNFVRANDNMDIYIEGFKHRDKVFIDYFKLLKFYPNFYMDKELWLLI